MVDEVTDKAIEAACIAHRTAAESYGHYSAQSMRSAIAAYEQAMWSPHIPPIPKDGRFLLFAEGRVVLADRCSAFGFYVWRKVGGSAHDFTIENPTHYRPLPPPPGKEG